MQANPSVGKDQPPDLAFFVPSDSAALPGTPENANSAKGPSENNASADVKSTKVTGKTSLCKNVLPEYLVLYLTIL